MLVAVRQRVRELFVRIHKQQVSLYDDKISHQAHNERLMFSIAWVQSRQKTERTDTNHDVIIFTPKMQYTYMTNYEL